MFQCSTKPRPQALPIFQFEKSGVPGDEASTKSVIRIYGMLVNFKYAHSNMNSLATLVVAIYTT